MIEYHETAVNRDSRADLTRWEYKLVQMGNPLEAGVEERANAFGHQGWELVAIDAGVWVFKRPRAPETEPPEPLRALVEETIPLEEIASARVTATSAETIVGGGTAIDERVAC